MSNSHRHRRHIGRNAPREFSFRTFDHETNFRDLPDWRTFYRPFGFVPFEEADLDVTDGESALQVKYVDFSISENAKAHHTSEYEIVHAADRVHQPVVRRGQPFDISITFNKSYNEAEYDLKLVFEIGKRPVPSKGTLVNIILSDKQGKTNEWAAKITSSSDNTVHLNITASSTCIVGRWNFGVDVSKKSDKKETYRYYHKNRVYILFNPWCKDDSTYFSNKTESGPDNELLQEYVLNESGKIYTGSCDRIQWRAWNFGQFEGNILDCIMRILEENAQTESCWNPIFIVRRLSALVNSPDDSGILCGNWTGDYCGGKSPLHWSGSVEILEEYYKTESPVCYGQCWVFSGIFTTALRTLGIPGRSVTNFDSAHDNDGSTTIDVYFTSSGEEIEDMNCDSVWNFHVWNEAYMTRPDLPVGYGGWQTCDATPQETSHGIYCCGPVSVAAVKHGDVNYPYDAPFVFAEVNADRVFWTFDDESNVKQITVMEKAIGNKISTKKPESALPDNFWYDDREDITLTYKHQEGSDAERAAVVKANQLCSKAMPGYECTASDVVFKIVHKEDCRYGKPFDVILQIENNSEEKRTIGGQVSASSIFYTGVFASLIKRTKVDDVMEPLSGKRIKMNLTFSEYDEYIVQHCTIKISVLCMVEETRQILTDQYSTPLSKPNLTIKAVKDAQVDKVFKTEITFVNPLPVPLTCCVLVIEGPGLQKPMTMKQPSVCANGTFFANIELTPAKPGPRNLIANFSSKEIEGINGVCSIKVAK